MRYALIGLLLLPLVNGLLLGAAPLANHAILTARQPLAAPRASVHCVERVAGPRTSASPPPDDLADSVMLEIVLEQLPDEEVNALAWKYLGYKQDENQEWDASNVFPKWAAKYPEPPDLIGVTRTYWRVVDEPVLRAVQSLQRSVPKEHKDNLRAYLKPLGWNGFMLKGLTPNMTRRAQVANWLLYYREALHGVSLEEVSARAATPLTARTSHS